jgi:hypothetical protein
MSDWYSILVYLWLYTLEGELRMWKVFVSLSSWKTENSNLPHQKVKKVNISLLTLHWFQDFGTIWDSIGLR